MKIFLEEHITMINLRRRINKKVSKSCDLTFGHYHTADDLKIQNKRKNNRNNKSIISKRSQFDFGNQI
jgi:hypothetical protein